MVNIDANAEIVLVIKGAALVAILEGLGYIPHRIAKPIEDDIIQQIVKKAGAERGTLNGYSGDIAHAPD